MADSFRNKALVSVLMSESLNHLFNRFIQTADSFRNKALVSVLMSESLNHLFNRFIKKRINSVSKHRPLLREQNSAVIFVWNYFVGKIEQ